MRGFPTIRRTAVRAALSALVCVAFAPLGSAQELPAAPSAPPEGARVDLAAAEDVLWLVVGQKRHTTLFHRSLTEPFDLGFSIDRPVALTATFEEDALIFFEDGSIYRYSTDHQQQPQKTLPSHALPLEVVGIDSDVYAIVPSRVALDLGAVAAPPPEQEANATTTAPAFDPGAAELSIVHFDGRRWAPLTPAPQELKTPAQDDPPPRVQRLRDRLLLVWKRSTDDRLMAASCRVAEGGTAAPGAGDWSPPQALDAPDFDSLWLARVGRVATIVLQSRAGDGAAAEPRITALRMLGPVGAEGSAAWKQAALQLSSMPQGVQMTKYTRAVGYNQHVVLLGADERGRAFLRFARVDAEPAEKTIDVSQVLAEPRQVEQVQIVFQIVTLLALVMILVVLFVFRRDSMIQGLVLPPGVAVAFATQRLLGWLIDFVPFAIAAAAMLEISVTDGLAGLTSWAINPENTRSLPQQDLLLWWGLTCGGHALYAAIMEWLTGRTVGKVLARTFVLSESGGRPRFWQILLRNFMRVIELMPQFWVFVILVLLSRNRQRLGDIFARTCVVRRVPIVITIDEQTERGTPQDQGGQLRDSDRQTENDQGANGEDGDRSSDS
jgi:uncharacterized RDD family membrane protein YckC